MGGFADFQAIVESLKTPGDIVTALITPEKARLAEARSSNACCGNEAEPKIAPAPCG